MRKISIWLAGALVLTAIIVTFFTTSFLFLRYRRVPQDKLLEAADLIETNFIGESDRKKMTDAAISGMVDSLGDRWSYYLTAEQMEQYRRFESNQYTGLGLVVKGSEEGGVVIHAVYPDSPAGEAGILPGSVIIRVDGRDARSLSLEETLNLVADGIEAGRVELGLLEPDGQERDVTLIPGSVKTEPVSWELLPDGLGLIRIENFEDRSGDLAVSAVEELCSQGAKGLIFDVRENPGGQLQQLLKILDRLLPKGVLFISRDIQGKEDTEYSDAECVSMPMAVLVNGDTYSAAEFFAAALQEYEWAAIVGEHTTGKGYAQVTLMLTDGSAIHLSAVEYFTPQGKNLDGVGLTPDLEVGLEEELLQELTYGLLAPEEDPQLEAARGLLLDKIADKP